MDDLRTRIETDGYIREDACSSSIVSLYPVKKVFWAKQTPYAEAVIAECPGLGKTLFLDNEVQSSQSDEDIYHECLVHPVMASVPSNCRNNVLVIGGGEGATVREVLKWSDVKHVSWVDIDGELVKACREHLGWVEESIYEDPRVEYRAEDIRVFLKENARMFDVVIIDLPDPDITLTYDDENNLQNNSFWEGVRGCLNPDGAFVSHCGPVRRGTENGFTWIRNVAQMNHIPVCEKGAYHTVIPAFQDDWGYLMSCEPKKDGVFDFPTRFLNSAAYTHIFSWAFKVIQ